MTDAPDKLARRPKVLLDPLKAPDFSALRALARSIWHEHYASVISRDQIDYMLSRKYTPEDLSPYVNGRDRWFDVLRVDGEPRGFLRCQRERATVLKLSEIYLAKACRGQGLGQRLLRRAEDLAQAAGCTSITLYVNRRNTLAIRAYERAGYAIRRECDVDIGNGYVMNDYLMEKLLPA